MIKTLAGSALLLLLAAQAYPFGPEMPTNADCPVLQTGDVNLSGALTSADIIYMVGFVFKSGSEPLPCEASADVNCDGAIDPLDLGYVLARFGVCDPVPDCKQDCPAGTIVEPPTKHSPPASPCECDQGCGQCSEGADPVDSVYLFSGEFYHSDLDLRIAGRGIDFLWARKYRSRIGPDTAQGNGWDFSYNIFLEQSGSDLILHDGNTRQDTYLDLGGGLWETPAGFLTPEKGTIPITVIRSSVRTNHLTLRIRNRGERHIVSSR